MSNSIEKAIQRIQQTELSPSVMLLQLSKTFISRAVTMDFHESASYNEECDEFVETYELLAEFILSIEISKKA